MMTRKEKPTSTSNYEEDNWDDIEIPETGFLSVDYNDYGLSTTTRELEGITISDSEDDDDSEDDYFGKVTDYNSNKSTPASSTSSSSSIKKVKEMINSGVINNKEFSGLITRIGGENNKVIADDWDNDMEIPEDGFANLTFTNKTNRSIPATNDFEFDDWDEEEQNTTVNNTTVNNSTIPPSPRELIIKRIKDPSKVLSKSNTTQALENFDNDFDFSGVDLGKFDLSTKALKLHQPNGEERNSNDKDPFEFERYPSRNSSRLSILPSPAPTNGSQSAFDFESGDDDDSFDDIQFPEHMDSLTLISHKDDDDFENGLEISNESVFDPDHLKNKNITTRRNSIQQQKRTRRESFSIEFNTSPKDSSRPSSPPISLIKMVHPETIDNISTSVSSLKTNKVISKDFTSTSTTTTTKKNTSKPTSSKSQSSRPKSPQSSKNPKREVVKKPISISKSTPSSTNSTSKQSSKKTTNKRIESAPKKLPPNNKKSHKQNINPNNTPNNTNFNTTSTLEIMRKPKGRQTFGDGSELDRFDDLPVNFDKERSYTSSNSYTKHNRNSSVSSVCSKTDNSNTQHHRKHKKNRRKKKPQLIKNLNVDKSPKVIGEMVYNPTTQRWDGNDSVLKDFDNILSSPTRPALISNMNNANTKSLQVVGKMRFDPTKMCWNNDSSDEEKEIFARFDYDDDQDGFISSHNTSSVNTKKNKSILHYQPKDVNSTSEDSNDFEVGPEFDITPGFLAALLASERQHRNEITRWYPDALSKKNNSRFGLRDVTLQRGYLYDLRNNNRRNAKNPSNNNPKIYRNNRSGGLFEAALNLTRPERRHFF